MSSAVMTSPARAGSTPITNVYFKCDDCGDVSHSQASLSLHRSVCHSSVRSRNSSDSEVIEKNSDPLSRSEQIAESCECPKCGENLLLLRERNFNCALCDYQDTDQSRFFVHLKEHYEHSGVINVEPGSLIIEQVIDDNDLNHDDDEPVDRDDRDDPEYVPDNDDMSDDDVEVIDQIVSKAANPEKDPLKSKKVSPIKKHLKATPVKKLNENIVKPKMGISWHSPTEKGAPKKLSFVKTPATTASDSNWAALLKKPKNERSSPASKDSLKKQAPAASSKWVRLVDIKYLTPSSSSYSTISPEKAAIKRRPRPPGDDPEEKSAEKAKKPKPAKASKAPKEPKPPKEKKLPVCGVCKRIFSTATSLKWHTRIHTGEKLFTCDQCGKAFTQWSTCQQHIESIHSGVKKYTCEFCGASFARNSGLRLHRRIHTGEITHQCNICGKGFRCKSYLDRHRTFHTGEKRYKCEFCSKTFRTSTDMKRHRNSVHFGLGNVSLTAAKELLMERMDGFRTPQRPTAAVVQRFVEEDSSSGDDSEEVIRATTIITGSHYEM